MDTVQSKPALGVIFHPGFPPETLPDYARRAEAAGFDELWLWDDCFLPGALTSAAIALTTLARAFPGRILPGFGHGLARWMAQIGAAPRSSLTSLGETVDAVR